MTSKNSYRSYATKIPRASVGVKKEQIRKQWNNNKILSVSMGRIHGDLLTTGCKGTKLFWNKNILEQNYFGAKLFCSKIILEQNIWTERS